MSNFRYKMVVVVRGDLKLSKGKLAVQVAHAAVTCAINAKKKHPLIFKKWIKEGQKKVVLRTKDLKELEQLGEKAKNLGVVSVLISDAGLTEIEPGTVTCLGIGPEREEIIDKITGKLPLL